MEQEQRIDYEKVDDESFEKGYKEAFKELLENEAKGNSGNKIEILFNENGEWSGHLWNSNCQYSLSDLERNKDYKLKDEVFYSIYEQLRNWEQEVRENLITD
ncbi:MAG: hypothetical protein GY874_04405 [Desulfobacteraceae bacterium]|nr:hypothetical protein [Desulfobacteraceae bacterium]